jgi:hypothetical protein
MGELSPSEKDHIVDGLIGHIQQLSTLPYEVKARASYGFEEYQPADIDPSTMQGAMEQLTTFIEVARGSYFGQLAKQDTPHIEQFHVDRIPNGQRILLTADTPTHNYKASVIQTGEDTIGVWIMRSIKGLTGIDENRRPTHKPGDYLDFKVNAPLGKASTFLD